MKKIIYQSMTALLAAVFFSEPASADIQETYLPEPQVLLVLGSCLMVFAFYTLLRNK